MDLRLTGEQEAIRETFAAIFEKESSPKRVRELGEAGFDAGLWQVLTSAGALEVAIDREGGGFVGLALIAAELGRRLAAVPLVEAAIAAYTLGAFPGRTAKLLERVVAGELVATYALHPATDGSSPLVIGGAVAGLVVALDGDELVAVEGPAGRRRDDLGFLALADRDLRGAEVVRHVLAEGAEAHQVFRAAGLLWRAGTAAALAGLGREALRIGVDYAGERHQFGVPIGSFQAVQHGFADLAVRVEGSELLALKASWSADQAGEDWAALCAMAYAHAAEAAQDAAAASLHYHGGYGVTLEYDIHRYVRRAKGWALAAGDLEDEWRAIGGQHIELAGG